MELSYSHRFIFIHVYRVGGQSIAAALRPYAHIPGRRVARVPLLKKLGRRQINRLREHNHGHIKAKDLEPQLPAETFDSFFKFAFVRNPWDWHVSIYHYVLQRPDHPDHDFYRSLGGFEDYLDWRIHRAGAELQTEFVLSDDGELAVDFVGRYESFGQDFAAVCERVGIPYALPHRNRSEHRDFREYYTPETKALVAEAYRDDIEFFGYEFDRQERLPPIRGPGEADRARPPVSEPASGG
jgi:hypothetical protein